MALMALYGLDEIPQHEVEGRERFQLLNEEALVTYRFFGLLYLAAL